MFDYLVGKVVEIDDGRVVLEVNNIGYSIYLSFRDLSSIEVGKEYKVYLYRHLYENGDELYGFLDRDSRKVFLALMSVSSVGSKLAMKILSHFSPSEIVRAVIKGDTSVLSSVKGISEKTSERIVAELKSSIHKLGIKVDEEKSNFDDIVKALRSLGYNQNDILFAINTAKKSNPRLLYEDISTALHSCLAVLKNR
ncbi:MAG: Holliday junction branch migration protein RuvA [Spirochaetia bacterium]|nr:Holliday junction branch migration protein RuvA [Spirochaetota bacterium]MCX8096380.1 Holliday junction branch migration protein RuvA [Spirochaetota bacterium]MDW8112956.1 Holliday junction branch migration protein RuvA [Spirochaetia bacterium]